MINAIKKKKRKIEIPTFVGPLNIKIQLHTSSISVDKALCTAMEKPLSLGKSRSHAIKQYTPSHYF